MSLTSILNTPTAREVFGPLIRKPGLEGQLAMLVPPQGNDAPRVGIAFDYALRFGLQARGYAQMNHLVAERGVNYCQNRPALAEYAPIARHQLGAAKDLLSALTSAAELDPRVADACYKLAGLDIIFRAGRIDQVGQKTTAAEKRELQALYRIVPCTIEATRQIVCYTILANRFGISGNSEREEIDQLGIYFGRAGELCVFPMSNAIDPEHHVHVLRFLVKAGEIRRMTLKDAQPTPSLQEIAMRWHDILASVRARSRSAVSVLREGTPAAVDGYTLTIVFEHSFHKERVAEDKARLLIEETLEQLFGVPLRIQCVLRCDAAPESTVGDARAPITSAPQSGVA